MKAAVGAFAAVAASLFALAPAIATTTADPSTINYPTTEVIHVNASSDPFVSFYSKVYPNGTANGTISAVNQTGYQGTSSSITQGAFSYAFDFALGSAGLGTGSFSSVTTQLFSGSDIDFTNVTFNGHPVQIFSDTVNGSGQSITFTDSAGLSDVAVAAFDPAKPVFDEILVQGYVFGGEYANGAFSGNLSFVPSAAPEPTTWAMMLVGFGIAGTGLRKRRQSQSLSFA